MQLQQLDRQGLSTHEVEERRAHGRGCVPPPVTGRSYLRILLFMCLLIVLAVPPLRGLFNLQALSTIAYVIILGSSPLADLTFSPV